MILSSPVLARSVLEGLVRAALEEDLGGAGDITSTACIPADATMRVEMRAREAGVLAGIDCAALAFWLCDPDLDVEVRARDGSALEPGQAVLAVAGNARAILAAERTALNFACHLSGIATLTRRYVDAVAGTGAAIAPTRKSLPLLRAVQKSAVISGGGSPHRHGLGDAVLIKDNHIAAAGGIGAAVAAAKAAAGHMIKVSVEVDTLDQLEEARVAGPDVVLLDNFSLTHLREAVSRAKGEVLLEASGGVNLDTVRAIAETGVDAISVGALTHSASVLDLGLDVTG